MEKTLIGENENGTPRHHYDFRDDPDFLGAVLFTGPIMGTISLADGTAYDVTDDVIHCKPEHIEELQLAIHKAHHAAGRFLDSPLPGSDSEQ